MAITPLQSALSSALSGLRRATADNDKAAADVTQAFLSPSPSAYGAAGQGSVQSQASPDLYAAVATRVESRQRFTASLTVLRTADQMLAETTRLL